MKASFEIDFNGLYSYLSGEKVGIVVVSKYFKDLKRIDQLNEIEHWVTQQSGTERPGTGKYLKNKNLGIYVDIIFVETIEPPIG